MNTACLYKASPANTLKVEATSYKFTNHSIVENL